VNKTILKEEASDPEAERLSKRDGRAATYAGGTVVGLSGAGIAAGITAIGGGSAIVGTIVVFAAPAVVALGIGYGVDRLSKLFRS
jgi:hypothetical protein